MSSADLRLTDDGPERSSVYIGIDWAGGDCDNPNTLDMLNDIAAYSQNFTPFRTHSTAPTRHLPWMVHNSDYARHGSTLMGCYDSADTTPSPSLTRLFELFEHHLGTAKPSRHTVDTYRGSLVGIDQ